MANITNCPHTDRKHCAKGMCRNCYAKYYRNKNIERMREYDRNWKQAKGKHIFRQAFQCERCGAPILKYAPGGSSFEIKCPYCKYKFITNNSKSKRYNRETRDFV